MWKKLGYNMILYDKYKIYRILESCIGIKGNYG